MHILSDVTKVLRGEKMTENGEAKIHYTPGEKRAMIVMYFKGRRSEQLLEEYGVCQSTLRRWEKELKANETESTARKPKSQIRWKDWASALRKKLKGRIEFQRVTLGMNRTI